MKPLRVYVDTSVFGGVFDSEFDTGSKMFFSQVLDGYFSLVTSAVVRDEIAPSPQRVKEFFKRITKSSELLEISKQAISLRNAYLEAEILPKKYADDAMHVALATTSLCPLIVSWNFKHIVHFNKIGLYNAVNRLQGFSKIAIFSPSEVLSYEKEKN